jgi:hypothetical protein
MDSITEAEGAKRLERGDGTARLLASDVEANLLSVGDNWVDTAQMEQLHHAFQASEVDAD